MFRLRRFVQGQCGCFSLVRPFVVIPHGMQFGRTPSDLAFAAGNRKVFAVLHEATQKAAASVAAPEEEPEIPDPSEFWEYLQKQGAIPPTQAGAAQAPLNPDAQAARKIEETHPRKQFEAWLGGILFPQRQHASAPVATSGTPYGSVNQSAKPPPSLAKPAFTQMMKQGGQHGVGHAGGSQFAARRAAKEAAHAAPKPAAAAAQAQEDGPVQNIQLTLDPYEDAGPEQASAAGGYGGAAQVEERPENPLAAMMQAIGKKAQSDIKVTMDGVASMMSSLPPPTPAERLREQQAKTGACHVKSEHIRDYFHAENGHSCAQQAHHTCVQSAWPSACIIYPSCMVYAGCDV